MITPNPPINNNITNIQLPQIGPADNKNAQFDSTMKVVNDYLSQVDDAQQVSDASITELLNGNNEDITSVVSAVAKADMSFKLLVGVRNKLVEAYKQTMNMQV